MSFPHLSTSCFDTEEYYHQRRLEEDSESEEEEEYDEETEEQAPPAEYDEPPPQMFGAGPGAVFQASQIIIAGGDHRAVLNGNVTVDDRSTNHVIIGSQNLVGNVMQAAFNAKSYIDMPRNPQQGRSSADTSSKGPRPDIPMMSGARMTVSGTSTQFTTTSISADGITQQTTIAQNDIVAINDPALGQSINQFVQATKMLAMSGALASNPTFTLMTGGDAKITKEGHHILRLNANNVKGNQIMGSFNKDSEIQY